MNLNSYNCFCSLYIYVNLTHLANKAVGYKSGLKFFIWNSDLIDILCLTGQPDPYKNIRKLYICSFYMTLSNIDMEYSL